MDYKEFLSENFKQKDMICMTQIKHNFVSERVCCVDKIHMPKDNKDLYISMNTLKAHKRNKENVLGLRYLYMDLDYYKLGLSQSYVLNKLKDEYFEKKIPCPNMIIDSGRGLYLLWKIKESYKAVYRWRKVQRILFEQLKPLGADGSVVNDESRLLRMVGSINSKSGKEVKVIDYMYGNRILKLSYIEKYYGNNVCNTYSNNKHINIKNSYSSKDKSLMYKILNDVTKLLFIRNGKDCHRESMLFIIRHFTYALTGSANKALERIVYLNSKLRYPLSDKELINATSSAERYIAKNNKILKFTRNGLINFLNITEQESSMLEYCITDKQVRDNKTKRNRQYYLKQLKSKGKSIYADLKQKKIKLVKTLINKKLSVSEICKKADISKSTYYNYLVIINKANSSNVVKIKLTKEQIKSVLDKIKNNSPKNSASILIPVGGKTEKLILHNLYIVKFIETNDNYIPDIYNTG